MVLVFGCRQSKTDHIYREETLQAKNKGVFRELYTAYSREPDKPKVTSGPCTVPGPCIVSAPQLQIRACAHVLVHACASHPRAPPHLV